MTLTQWLQIDKSYNEKDIVNNILNSNIGIVKEICIENVSSRFETIWDIGKRDFDSWSAILFNFIY